MYQNTTEDILQALDEIVDFDNVEQVRKKSRKRSSILKQPKTSDDGLTTEDIQNKRKSVTSKRVSFAEKFQVMELCTGNIYDVSGRNGSSSDSATDKNLMSETTDAEENIKISEVSRAEAQISAVTKKCEMQFEQDLFSNVSKKHRTCSDENIEPQRKKLSVSHSSNSAVYLHIEKRSSAEINIESECCFNKILYNSDKNGSEIRQNQDMKLTPTKQDFQESSTVQEMLKEMELGMLTEDFSYRSKSNFSEVCTHQNEDIPIKENKLESNIFSVVTTEKNISSTGCLSKYNGISNIELNMKLYPVTSHDVSLQENKENVYIDVKNKNILVTNDRQLKLSKGTSLRKSQSQYFSSVKSQVSDIKGNKDHAFASSNIKHSVDLIQDCSSKVKNTKVITDQQKNVNCDKTCLFTIPMDVTCIVPDITNDKAQVSASYNFEHYVDNAKDCSSEVTHTKNILHQQKNVDWDKTHLFSTSMDLTCFGTDSNNIDDSDVFDEKENKGNFQSQYFSSTGSQVSGVKNNKAHSFASSNIKHSVGNIEDCSSKLKKTKVILDQQKNESRNKTCLFATPMSSTCIVTDIKNDKVQVSGSSNFKLSVDHTEDCSSKVEKTENILNQEKNIEHDKTCLFATPMDLTCFGTDTNNDDSKEEDLQICESDKRHGLISKTCYESNKTEVDITREATAENTSALLKSKRQQQNFNKTKLYSEDMDMTCVNTDFSKSPISWNASSSDFGEVSEKNVNTGEHHPAPFSNLEPKLSSYVSKNKTPCTTQESETSLAAKDYEKSLPSESSVPQYENSLKGETCMPISEHRRKLDFSKTHLFNSSMDLTCFAPGVNKLDSTSDIICEERVQSLEDYQTGSLPVDDIPRVSPNKQSEVDITEEINRSVNGIMRSVEGLYKTKLYPVDMDMTCANEKTYRNPSEKDSTHFDTVSENPIDVVKQQPVHDPTLFSVFARSPSVSQCNRSYEKLSCAAVSKLLLRDSEDKDISSCKTLSKTRCMEDQSIFCSNVSPDNKNADYEKENALHSSHICSDKFVNKEYHSDMLHENVSSVKDKRDHHHSEHSGESSEGLCDLNISQDRMHALTPKDFNKTHFSDIPMDMTCYAVHSAGLLKEDKRVNFNSSGNLHKINENMFGNNENSICEESTAAASSNRQIENSNQSKLHTENVTAAYAEDCSDQDMSVMSTHVNLINYSKHDTYIPDEQRENRIIPNGNTVESNNKIVESAKSANTGIVYAIKQLKEMSQTPSFDGNVFKFPEVFFSLRKQPKPKTSFSCTKIQLCEAVRNAIRESCSFNYGFKELSFTTETDKNYSFLPVHEHDKLDGKVTAADLSLNLPHINLSVIPESETNRYSSSSLVHKQEKPDEKETSSNSSVNLHHLTSDVIPEHSENIENLVGTDTDVIPIPRTSQLLNIPQDEELHLISDSILDNSFVQNDTVSVSLKIPSLHRNLHQGTPTKSKFEITVEKVITPQSIKKTFIVQEETLMTDIFIGNVSRNDMTGPSFVITNPSLSTSAAEKAISSTSISKKPEDRQTHFLSPVSAVSLHNATNNSQKLSVSKSVSKAFKVPSENEKKKLNRNLAPQFEQLSELKSDLSLSDLNDEVFISPLKSKNPLNNFGEPQDNPLLNEKFQYSGVEKELNEVINSKSVTNQQAEKQCRSEKNCKKQTKSMENLTSSSSVVSGVAAASKRSVEKIDTLHQRKNNMLHFLRKKFIEASEDADNLWELKEINENQAVFELNGYCLFACYLMTIPLAQESEVSSEKEICFQHLKPEPDEIDELGLLLFHSRISKERESFSLGGDIDTVCATMEKLLHKISECLDVISIAKAFIKDVWFVAIKNEISIDTSQELPRLIVKILNQNTFSMFNLTFTLNLKTYPLEKIVPEIEYLEFTHIENEVILGALDKIEPGTKYLFRMVEAVHAL